MGIFDVFKSKTNTLDDPTLGRLTFRKPAHWECDVTFAPTGNSVMLFLSGDESGPTSENRSAFNALVERYDEIKTELEEDLFELYENCNSDGDAADVFEDYPDLSTQDQIWQCTALYAVDVQGPGSFELTFSFDWDDGHDITVHIIDWKSHGTSIDG